MSAFVVDDKTINRIVSFINTIGMAGHVHKFWAPIQPLIKLGYVLDTDIGCKRLAEEMFTLNCDSVEQRYGEGQAEEFRPLDFQYQYCGSGVGQYQVLKSLRCFLYQCCEGNIPAQNALYKALEDISLNICYQIVSRSAEYEAAVWG